MNVAIDLAEPALNAQIFSGITNVLVQRDSLGTLTAVDADLD